MGLLTGTDQEYYEGDDLGNYQFTSLEDIINQFIIAYVGDGKIISKVKRTDVAFHAQRALQEFSFDTFKSIKSQEITLPPSLTMALPRDYVNYVKLTWSDASGIEHVIYPIPVTSNPTNVLQNEAGTYQFTAGGELKVNQDSADNAIDSKTWDNYKSATPSENQETNFEYDNDLFNYNLGQRYGLDPQYSQINGSFYIDELKGMIHFSSNIAGETVLLKYISDSLGTEAEMKVHKFAEEAMYKQIANAILSTSANVPEYIVNRFKKDARASKRNAKLRLSNIKLEEITQVLRGKSKQIKH
tara:strand:- start:9471 stop:10370 length:900 start_codon:yes stop_codon:yes gene_type:complete